MGMIDFIELLEGLMEVVSLIVQGPLWWAIDVGTVLSCLVNEN